MEQWNIRIGTTLDTNGLESKLKSEISKIEKNKDNNIDIKLNIDNNSFGNLEKLKTELKDIAKIASSIKIDLKGFNGTDKLAKDINNSAKKLQQEAEKSNQALIGNTSKAIENSASNMEKELQRLKNTTKDLSKEFQSLSKNPFISDKELGTIKECTKLLGNMSKKNMAKLDDEGIKNYKTQLLETRDIYRDIVNVAKNNEIKANFNAENLTPFMETLKTTKEYLKVQGIDTKGIDNLIRSTRRLEQSAKPIEYVIEKYKELQSTFKQRIQDPFKTSSIKNAETGISELLKMRAKLVNETLKPSIDISDLERANSTIDEIDKSIKRIKKNLSLTSTGQATSNALIDNSNVKLVENLGKKADEARKRFDNLNNSVKNLWKDGNNDMSKIIALDSWSKNVESQLNNLTGKGLTTDAIQKVNEDLNTMAKGIEAIKTGANNVKLNQDFDDAIQKATRDFENLRKSAEAVNYDMSKITPFGDAIKSLQGLNKLDINGSALDRVNDVIKQIKSTMDDVGSRKIQLKLEAKFDNDFENVKQSLNGLESALMSKGLDTSRVSQLRSELEALDRTNLENASNGLKNISNEINNLASQHNLGNVKGDMKQLIDMSNEYKKAMSNATSSSDVNMAKGFEEQANRIDSAMKRLTSSFSQAQQEQAKAFTGNAFKGASEKFTAEIDKTISAVDKLKSVMYNMDKVVNFNGLKSDAGRQISEQFSQAYEKAMQIQEKLNNMKLSGNVDNSKLKELQAELQKCVQDVSVLSGKSIIVKCDESIASLEKMKAELQAIGKDTSGIDGLINKFRDLQSNLNNGKIVDSKQAIGELRSLGREFDNVAKSSQKSLNSMKGFGTKIEGFFGSIKNAFSSFGLGMIISRMVFKLTSGIKEAVTGLDAALVDFSRVKPDDYSINTANLEAVANKAREIGISVGQSTEDVIKGMSTALRAGATSMEQACAIAEKSAIFQNVTDMSAEDASKAVAGLVNQYYSMDTALQQVDKGVGASIQGYTNLTQAMDLVLICLVA